MCSRQHYLRCTDFPDSPPRNLAGIAEVHAQLSAELAKLLNAVREYTASMPQA
jgi:hypothetical protein